MKSWKVTAAINNRTEQETIFIKHAKTMEEAYSEAKRYYILQKPEIDFCGVVSATEI